MTASLRMVFTASLVIGLAATAGAGEMSPGELAAKVDRLWQQETAATARQPVDDETFLRRVSLDLTGKPPTPEQVTLFVLDPAPQKRQKMVESLLADEDFGRNWGRYWRDVILYRSTDDRARIVSGGARQYFANALNSNRGWDEIATDLITATGDIRENGETVLMFSHLGKSEEIAAETARIFLGMQINCAQCHDHPTDKWKREQFHQLAAFFPRVGVRPIREENRRSFAIVSNDGRRRFNFGGIRKGREHYMPDLENPKARGKLIHPTLFITGQKLESGQKDMDRRQTLARWITAEDNPWFAKAFVNRTWAELLGRGFYEPVDDMGPERSAIAPETLELIAEQFVARQYDVKWLFQVITQTQAYQARLVSEEKLADPAVARRPQRLRGDQIYDSLLKALGLADPAANASGQRGGLYARRGPRGQFLETFGFDPSLSKDDVVGSIPQALALMNSRLINLSLNGDNRGTVLGKVLAETDDDKQVVVELYLHTLAREPSPAEMKTSLDYVREVGNRKEAFEDLHWALINSTEFLHRR